LAKEISSGEKFQGELIIFLKKPCKKIELKLLLQFRIFLKDIFTCVKNAFFQKIVQIH